MTMPTSQRAVDGGRIKGSADVPQVVEIVVKTSITNGKTIRNVCHGHYTGSAPNVGSIAAALATSIGTAWSSNLASLMHTGTSYIGVECRDMTSHNNPIFLGTATAIPGSGTGSALPPEVAAVLTETILARGRGWKGRMYIGGFCVAADAGGGIMTAATQTGMNGFGTALLNAINGQSLTPCVAQVARQQYVGLDGTVHPSRSASFIQVSGYVCRDLQWDTQRRRGLA